MDSLIRQMRLRYVSGEENRQPPGISYSRDPSMSFRRTSSFTREKRKAQGLIKKSPGQSGPDNESGKDVESAAAIAAAALAVSSLGKSGITEKEKPTEGAATSLAKPKSKIEDTFPIQESISRRSSGEQPSMKSSEDLDRIVPIDDSMHRKMSEKAFSPAPSIRTTATEADKRSKEGRSSSSRKHDDSAPKLKPPPAKQPSGTENQSSIKKEETKANVWEKTKMEKIKHRYEKLIGTITSWEDGKKKKAQRRKTRTEAKLGQRSAKSIQHYNDEMRKISEIAEAAKEKARKIRRREESKVKEKANKMRTTGEKPTKCPCF